MPEIVLKDKNGTEQVYNKDKIFLRNSAGEKVTFEYGTNPNIQPLTVTENGTYEANDVADGYSPVTVSVPVPTELTDVPITLDFSEGNQTVAVDDGYAVKSAIIQKPDTLISENIKKNVNVAGIIGTHEGGSGESELVPIVIEKTFDDLTSVDNITELEHGLGVIPDLMIFRSNAPAAGSLVNIIAMSEAYANSIGADSRQYAQFFNNNGSAIMMLNSSSALDNSDTTGLGFIHNSTPQYSYIGGSIFKLSANVSYSLVAFGGLVAH